MPSKRIIHGSHWGAFIAEVEGGQLDGIYPMPEDPSPTPIVGGIQDGLTSSARVGSPSIRKSWLRGGPGTRTDLRGAEEFVTVSWEEALSLVADELRRVRDRYGNQSIFAGSYGWASAGRFHHAKTQLARFLNCYGGFTAQVQNYSFAAASTILPYVLGEASIGSGDVTSWDVLEGNTRLWVMFGGVPLKNTQVESGGVLHHTASNWLRRLKASGIEFVSITPDRDDAPDFLDARWIAPRPNTDTAIMLGLAHTLLVEQLHDEAFLSRFCVGWDVVREYLLGEIDGQPKTAEWSASIADVNSEDLRWLARKMANTRTYISATWSLQRADHGEQPYWMTIALASMLGQIGLPGGGFGFAHGSEAAIGNSRYPFAAPALATGKNLAGSWIPVARIVDMLLNPGVEYEFNGGRYRYPDTHLIYWAGGNPFHHHQDINRLIDAWRRPESIVVNEIWWTATARHADIVLPATTTLERNDIGAASRDNYLIAMPQVVEPIGEAWNDYDIFAALAQRLGFALEFTDGRNEMEWLTVLYNQTRASAKLNDIHLPDFETFWARGYVKIWDGREHVPLSDFRKDPIAHPLSTPTGRIELFSEVIASFGYDDCPGHPVWLEPTEWLGSDKAVRYPLHLISNQPATRLHSQLDMCRVSLKSKVRGREPCRMSAEDANIRGIRDGDVVRIFNDRGSCLAGAQISNDLRAGVIQLSTGAWYDPLEAGVVGTLEIHGNPNVLTPDRGTSRLAQGPAPHSNLVQVEKFEGEVPPITIFEPPRMSADSATGNAS